MSLAVALSSDEIGELVSDHSMAKGMSPLASAGFAIIDRGFSLKNLGRLGDEPVEGDAGCQSD